jgi:hypothetical protein
MTGDQMADTVEVVVRDSEIVMVPLAHGQPRDFFSHGHYPVTTPLLQVMADATRFCGVLAGRVYVRRERGR